jgi:hypothetical protein
MLTLLLLLIQLAGCSTHSAEPMPVLVVYHVRPGAEKAVRYLAGQLWEAYQREGMVREKPHVCAESPEQGGRRIVEVVTYRGPYAMEYPPESVEKLLAEIRTFCEERKGNPAIEFHLAELLAPTL